MADNQVTLDFDGLTTTAEQDAGFVQGPPLEQVSVVDETNPTASPRVAKLVPVPGSSDSFYLSYDGQVHEGDPVYTLPAKPARKKSVNIGPVTVSPMKSILKPGIVASGAKVITQQLEGGESVAVKSEEPETLFATNQLEVINKFTGDDNLLLSMKPEPISVAPALMAEGATEQGSAVPGAVMEAGDAEDLESEEGEEEDFFDDPGDQMQLNEAEMEDDDLDEDLPSNVKDKIDQVVKRSGGYKFSGSWKKPPKAENLVKARKEVLQQILEHYKRTCKVCFEQQHADTARHCPLLNPEDTIENKPECKVRFGMPDEIVFGVSRVYYGQDSLFARDEIPEYTQFGPIEGKIVTMQDLATMGVVKNELDVSNLWPFPIEEGQHEFDFQCFLDTQDIAYSNWLKFIKVESPKEEHPPYNIQTVYKGKEIYFVTTKEIEPGGELFLRAIEPPSRVYYNMHRLGEVYYNFCSRMKCKPGKKEHLHLPHLLAFVRHQFLVHQPEHSVFSWAAIYNCTICHEDCFDKENYEDHMKQEHNIMNVKKPPNSCRFCGIVLKTKNYMYKHIQIHHGNSDLNQVPCPYCGKLFKHSAYLQNHIKGSHTDEPEACPICNRSCKNRSRMRSHLRKVHRTNLSEVEQLRKEMQNDLGEDQS